MQNVEREASKDCVCRIFQYWSSLLLGDLRVYYYVNCHSYRVDVVDGMEESR